MTMSRNRRLRSIALPAAWSSLDQVLSSVSNLVVVLAVARGGGVDTLGRYSIAFAAYLMAMGVGRSLVSEPMLAAPRDSDASTARGATLTLGLVYAVGCAALFGVLGVLLGRPEFTVMGLLLPAVLIQDLLRYHAFRDQRAMIAAALDGVWLLGAIAAWPALSTSASPVVAVAGWGAGGVAAAVIGLVVTRATWLPVGASFRWWKAEARRLAAPLVADSLAVVAATQGSVFMVVVLVGDGAMGVLRAGQVYFSPLGLLLTAGGMFAIPRLASRTQPLVTGYRLAFVSLAVAGLSAAVAAMIVLGEPLLRPYLFANSVAVPTTVLTALACQVALTAAAVPLVITAKVRNRGMDIAASRLHSVITGLVAVVVGTTLFGLVGVAWALTLQAGWFAADLARRTAAAKGRRAAPITDSGRMS